MAHFLNEERRADRDFMSAGFLSFGDLVVAGLGPSRTPAEAGRRGVVGRVLLLFRFGRGAKRADDVEGLSRQYLQDIGVAPVVRPSGFVSADVSTRLSIRANGGV